MASGGVWQGSRQGLVESQQNATAETARTRDQQQTSSKSPWTILGARIDELEAQNVALQSRLESVSKQAGSSSKEGPAGEYEALLERYSNLERRYESLKREHQKCAPYVKKATQKYNEAKDSARQWKAYFDKVRAAKEAKNRANVNHVQPSNEQDINATDTEEVTPRPQARADLHLAGPRQETAHHLATETGSSEVQTHNNWSSSRTMRITSSQTTELGSDHLDGRPARLQAVEEPESDFEPIMVSARSLKRKRDVSPRAPRRIKQEPCSPNSPVEIKSEEFSSQALLRPQVPRQDTSDLDSLGNVYRTPRRRRMHNRAVSEEVMAPPKLTTEASSLSDGVTPEDGLPAWPQELRNTVNEQHHVDAVDQSSQVLQPLSTNIVAKPPSVARRQRSDKNAVDKVKLLSEDGEFTQELPNEIVTHDKDASKTPASRRLESMLNEPVPDLRPLGRTPRPVPPGSKGVRKPPTPASDGRPSMQSDRESSKHRLSAASFHTPVTNAGRPFQSPRQVDDQVQSRPVIEPYRTPFGASKRGEKSRSPKKRAGPREQAVHGAEESPPPLRPEDEGLRNKPLSALRLEDFRVNPKYMGSDFAFSETFRGREQRRCLKGCTKPECCGGGLLHAAEAAGLAGSGKSDAELLEEHLGPNWQEIICAFTHERRTRLLEEARTAQFANKYGKHRHAFERRSTPPGFWRTEFPTTQEEAADRAKAQELTEQKVEERWREAMREGDGMWLFRDE
ncbi:hypothetical protein KC338_g4900 [Hortaea werneckii]|uniref:DNA endonuclease activator Ctp1 C-terminal domain-containing protein n=1 Tax=Hortaea werneckii TaxID=91943 RepID=A0A3M7F2D3_HORWE|nr:hypothetical protein KC323_g8821 [Hortaea werneckii]KAI6865971.1 hypothetical protein KC338_g4900 [Hortaea werneckii]KAI7356150.1 hypothetical protein KC320_g2360 [Hortaea werneckii]RMY82716.1 hypothetical protein D0862_11916 [Hortaea werneckii]